MSIRRSDSNLDLLLAVSDPLNSESFNAQLTSLCEQFFGQCLMIDSNSENDEITRLGSIWAIPNERTPGVSIIQPGFNASATAEEIGRAHV